MDISDTDNDGVIDMVAIGQGWEQNVSYATRSSEMGFPTLANSMPSSHYNDDGDFPISCMNPRRSSQMS